MIQLIVLLNVLLLFAGIGLIVKKLAKFTSRALLLLTSVVVLLISLSFLYYLMLISNQSFIILLVLLSIFNAGNLYFNKKELLALFTNISLNRNSFWALTAVLFFTCYLVLRASKYGGWDALAIWNLHAKFLYHIDSWRHLFTNDIAFTHPDYPLMLPSVIAFFWKGISDTSPFVPYLLSYGIMILIPLILFYALLNEGLNLFAYLALAVFVADSNYKSMASSQEADALLSLLILLTFVQFKNIKRDAGNTCLLGFICASCAWVKNEGIVFYLLFSLCFLMINLKNFPILKRYFLGILLPTLVLISFKLLLAPANDLVAANHGHTQSIISKLLDMHRYLTITQFIVNTVFDYYLYGVILMVAAFVLNRRFLISFPFLTLVALFAVYCIVYLLTPYDLTWHLYTSMNRLFLHVYPSFIYLSLLSLGSIKYKLFHTGAIEAQ